MSIRIEKPTSSTVGSTARFSRDPSSDPPIPAMPNQRPAATRTRSPRQWPTIPPSEATPTTTRDVVTADFGPRPTT